MRMPETEDQAGMPVIDVDVLISGAGPAGASLSCFLASHGKLRWSSLMSEVLVNYVEAQASTEKLISHERATIRQLGRRRTA